MNFRKTNNVVGWITGAIAFITYFMTMERTTSFWDCGEFLACAYKLEVGHSPGAPFFMLLQRLFAIFAPSTGQAAMFINLLSVVASALTILFLFWTITHMAKKLVAGNDEPDSSQILLIMGAGLIGGLAYTFSDTFWFSAVEGEVYATSSFFTAFTFWAILKWENIADNKYADRWLVLISFLVGISVCVHLLNLLTIPVLAMVYYYRRYTATTKGAIIAFLIGCVLLAFVQFGIIQYIPQFASKFDVLFVNDFGLPVDSGAITFILLLIAVMVWLLFYARRTNRYLLHTGILCVLFIFIGYSSYIIPIIRSRANVPVDMTNPDNVISFLSYVNREQFGQQPLFFGPDFTSPVVDIKSKGDVYSLTKKNGKDHYEKVGRKLDPVYQPGTERFFPRIWDGNDAGHAAFYRNYLGLGEGEEPTSADNMKYFWGYQMNWMWWRYFMWNYAGRQNDIEGQGDPKNGNWISGIKPIDKMMGHGDMDLMGDGFKNNAARNQLYFLPLILGILGLVYQFNRDKKNGIIVLVLFFFTGAAIGIFLNMPPVQPRERDYAFAGATYAFAIWIGLGVLMVHDWLNRAVKGKPAIYLTIVLTLLLVPVLMAKEEWNDHDRSKKTLARAVAFNTLQSCPPNAVLFTFGDNQTYPLWYLQEIEGIRKDVRVINTSLLGIDWYIDQLNYRINDADAVPMAWKKEGYVGDRNNYVRYYANPNIPQDKFINLIEICDFITSDDQANKLRGNDGSSENYMPTKNFFVPTLTRDQLVAQGLLSAADSTPINTEMKFTYPKANAYKGDLAILNIVAGVAKDGWKRPICFDAGLSNDNYVGMGEYLRLEGLIYHLMPYKVNKPKTNQQVLGWIDVPKTYDLYTKTYMWGGAERNDVYFDEPNRREFISYRLYASYTANELIEQGKKAEAIQVLDKVYKNITEHSSPYDYTGYVLAASYFRAGALQQAREITTKLIRNTEANINWVNSLDDDGKSSMAGDVNQDMQILGSLGSIAMMSNDSTTAQQVNQKLQMLYPKVSAYIGNGQQRQ